MFVSMYLCIYASMYLCIYVYTYACVCVCVRLSFLFYTCHTIPNFSFCLQCSHHIQVESETGSNAPAVSPSQEPPKLEPIDVLLGVSTPELLVRCPSDPFGLLEHGCGFVQASLLRVWLLWNWPWPPRLNPLTGLLIESTYYGFIGFMPWTHGHRQK